MICLNALSEKSLCEEGKRVGLVVSLKRVRVETYPKRVQYCFFFFFSVCWDLSLFVKANILLIAFLTLKLNQMRTESL